MLSTPQYLSDCFFLYDTRIHQTSLNKQSHKIQDKLELISVDMHALYIIFSMTIFDKECGKKLTFCCKYGCCQKMLPLETIDETKREEVDKISMTPL